MADPNIQQNAQSVDTIESNEFDFLLKKEFKPKTDEAKDAVERAVRTLAERALSATKLISTDVVKSIEAMIAQIDKKLTEQINLILHHADFQKLEASWRGLKYLLGQSETGTALKIKVLNVSKKDLLRDLQRAPEFDQSAMFKKVYEEEFGVFGGAPFGCQGGARAGPVGGLHRHLAVHRAVVGHQDMGVREGGQGVRPGARGLQLRLAQGFARRQLPQQFRAEHLNLPPPRRFRHVQAQDAAIEFLGSGMRRELRPGNQSPGEQCRRLRSGGR